MALKILLADDSMTAQNMGKKILTEAGYDIIAVSNGAAALKKIAELKPDIAILDVFMPGYTGPEVCERIKNVHETSKIPVLLTVGKMEMSAFKPEETNRVKADGLIIKPFEATDLIALIQKLEKKLAPAKPLPTAFESDDDTPQYEKTVKLDVREFRDASYDDWKSTAQEHTDEDSPKKPAPLSSEMGAAPVFMMDEAPSELRSTQILEKGQTVAMDSPAVPASSSNIQLPPAKPMASASAVPDWALGAGHPAAEIPAIEEVPAVAEAAEESASRETGVGKLLSKAKTWFGGTSTEESEPVAGNQETVATSVKGETNALDPAEMAPAETAFAAAPAPDWGAPPVTEMEAPSSFESAPEIAMAAEVPFEAVESRIDESTAHHAAEVEHLAAPQGMDVAHAIDPSLDTSMHRESHADVPVAIDPHLDTSMHRDTSEAESGAMDPALVTDPTEMASAFPTNFGVAGATIDPVGVAADVPGLYDNDQIAVAPEEAGAEVAPVVAPVVAEVAEEPVAGWRAEEHHLENHEHGVRLEHEMSEHYAAQAAVAEPDEAEVAAPAIAVAAGAHTNAPDMQFAAAMAAAVGAEMPAATGDGTAAMDPEMLARIVQRVTERMKPSLIAEITKELISEQQKDKK